MNKYVIIADSSIDLNKELRGEFGIEDPLNGIIYFPDGREIECDLEWNFMSPEEYFALMTDKKMMLKTALPKLGAIEERFENYLKNSQDILAITISSGLSGTYNEFSLAAKDLKEKYPERKILIVDSKRYGAAIGLLAIEASSNREKGLSLEDNFADLSEKVLGLHQMGILDDLYYLSRAGRISKFKATMGTMVGVKPMADFSNETGLAAILGNARGYKKSYINVRKYVKATIGDASDKIVLISNSIRKDQAEAMKKEIEEFIKPKRIISIGLGPTNGANVGPGLCAVYYFGNKISPNCEEEKALFEKINSEK